MANDERPDDRGFAWNRGHADGSGFVPVVEQRGDRLAVVTGVPNDIQDPKEAAAAAAQLNVMLNEMLSSGNRITVRAWDGGRTQAEAPAEPSEGPLGEVASRHLAASPGPWRRDGDVILDASGDPVALVGYLAFPARDPQPWHRSDAEFLTHAWADISALLEENDRLRAAGDA